MTRAVALFLVAALAGCGGASTPTPSPVTANQAPPPEPTPGGVQYLGDPSASVVIDYYFDYQCPACAQFGPTIDDLARAYGDRIVVYYRNFPIASAHPDARPAAIAAEAARRQGKFIEMHRALIARSPRLDAAELRAAAQEVGLDLARYDADVADPAAGAGVDREYDAAVDAGVSYVPFVRINGVETEARDPTELRATIDAQLR